jgi:hypothetical protein
MILGMSTEAFTLSHVVIRLIAIAAGAARRFHSGAPAPG